MTQLRRGLDLPLSGKPEQRITEAREVSQVALLGRDYPGMKPTLLVQEGDQVKLGQPLFSDKKNPGVLFTAPGAGQVVAIHRGERRAFISLVIKLAGNDELQFPTFDTTALATLASETVQERLLESGLWTALRCRPFSTIPTPGSTPVAIFVTAIDTNPLAADPALVIGEQPDFFQAGLLALTRLTAGKVYLCHAADAALPTADGITDAPFSGPHPAGLPGTHIHLLEQVSLQRQAWYIGYQDVIAIGALLLTGRIMTERVIALGGPGTRQPRLLRSRLGADLQELTAAELHDGEQRIISGSVLSGHTASKEQAFLGRYHQQVAVLSEGRERTLLGWLMPGFAKHSVKRLFASTLTPARELPLTTTTNGSLRAMVPIGAYEQVMPLNLQITWLLRSLLAGDLEMAQKLGCLELDEEDLALCSYVCPGKISYGQHLRIMLDRIAQEGL